MLLVAASRVKTQILIKSLQIRTAKRGSIKLAVLELEVESVDIRLIEFRYPVTC